MQCGFKFVKIMEKEGCQSFICEYIGCINHSYSDEWCGPRASCSIHRIIVVVYITIFLVILLCSSKKIGITNTHRHISPSFRRSLHPSDLISPKLFKIRNRYHWLQILPKTMTFGPKSFKVILKMSRSLRTYENSLF